ncbi:unnamed protein product [Echinostoma caproni]|uniref:Uncharacterized protein n=1 Tax=Echinostoma caproni TaxID=27848 RepID=A0A183ACS4_9TREM|nr:unnamed protein product [Echinostoma caproni]
MVIWSTVNFLTLTEAASASGYEARSGSFPDGSIQAGHDHAIKDQKHLYPKVYLLVPRVRKSSSGRHPLPRAIRHPLEERPRSFARYKLPGLTKDANDFIRIRNLCKARIREFQRNQHNGILAKAWVPRSALYKFMRQTGQNTPSTFALS